MVRIQTSCTIVDMKVEKNGVKQLEPSGWDEGSVLATLTGANAVLDASKAYVKFELTGAIKRVELEGFQPDGSVDPSTFFWIAKTLGASGFKPRQVQVVFVRKFLRGALLGQSAQDLCFVCVCRPFMGANREELKTGLGVGYGAQVLAHEFGHILGLDHAKGTDSLMYKGVFADADTRLDQQERMIIQSHPHVDRLAVYKPPPGGTVLSH